MDAARLRSRQRRARADRPGDERPRQLRVRSNVAGALQRLRHTLFVEAKWLGRGWWGEQWEGDAYKTAAGAADDVRKVARHVELGRCELGAVLVVDDECFFERHAADLPRHERVLILLASPAELERRGLGDVAELQAALDRIDGLQEAEEARIAKRADIESRQKAAAARVVDVSPDQRRAVIRALGAREFDLVLQGAVERQDLAVLTELAARAEEMARASKPWDARRARAMNALDRLADLPLDPIPTAALRSEDVPPPDATDEAIGAFAHTFDGYAHFAGVERAQQAAARAREAWERTSALPNDIDEARRTYSSQQGRSASTGFQTT